MAVLIIAPMLVVPADRVVVVEVLLAVVVQTTFPAQQTLVEAVGLVLSLKARLVVLE